MTVDELMTLPVVHVPLDPFPPGRIQRPSSKDPRIRPDARYLALSRREWMLGQFEEEWFGWVFAPAAGAYRVQLDLISDLYEIDLAPLV